MTTNWLKNKQINNSEIARQLGISPILFRMKLKNINRNRFTEIELQKLEEIRNNLLTGFKNQKRPINS